MQFLHLASFAKQHFDEVGRFFPPSADTCLWGVLFNHVLASGACFDLSRSSGRLEGHAHNGILEFVTD